MFTSLHAGQSTQVVPKPTQQGEFFESFLFRVRKTTSPRSERLQGKKLQEVKRGTSNSSCILNNQQLNMKKLIIALLTAVAFCQDVPGVAIPQQPPPPPAPRRGASGPKSPVVKPTVPTAQNSTNQQSMPKPPSAMGNNQQMFPSQSDPTSMLNPTIQGGNTPDQSGDTTTQQQQQRPLLPPSLDPTLPLPENTYLFHLIPMTSVRKDEDASKLFTSVIAALDGSPGRKFTFSDIHRFEKWYSQQSQSVKMRVKGMLKYEYIEFVGGTWVDHEQTCATWQEILATGMIAQRFVSEALNSRIKHAFTHSTGFPELYQRMGFESMSIGEVDKREVKWRREQKEMEFKWNGPTQGKGILTHIIEQDIPCNLGNPETPFSLKKDADMFFMSQLSEINGDHQSVLECLYNFAQGFKSNHVMFRVGGSEKSFLYAEAHFNFLERVMSILDGKKLISKNVTMHFRYSNFDTYFKQAAKQTFTTFEGDFLPYSGVLGDDEYYAIGVYSHRPLFKQSLRRFTSFASSALTFYAFDLFRGSATSPTEMHARAPKDSEFTKQIDMKSGKSVVQETMESIGEAMGSNGGTQSKVELRKAEDKMRHIAKKNSEIIAESLRKLIYRDEGLSMSQFYQCQYTQSFEISDMQKVKNWCPAGMSLSSFQYKDQFVTILFNPSAVAIQTHSRIAIQMLSEADSKALLKNMTAVIWNRESQTFVDLKTESVCNKRPTEKRVTSPNDTQEMDCEIMIYYPIQPLTYEIVKIIYKDSPEPEEEEEDEDSSDSTPKHKQRTTPVTDDPKLRGFTGMTYDLGDDLEYFKLCRDPSLVIKNENILLRIKTCIQNRVTFGMRRNSVSATDEFEFDFDFRYYVPYHGGGLVPGGLYVFKTTDKDSQSYQHKLKHVKVYNGKKMQMFVLTYLNRIGPLTQVKVKIAKDNPNFVEFDIFFGPIDKKRYQFGQEVTANFGAHQLNSRGVFYTDANAYRIVKHDTNLNKTYYNAREQNKQVAVSSYFYPVNSGLFIEDEQKKVQMLVMNDRPQAGSAYHCDSKVETPYGCRAEFIFIRRTQTSDNLGVHEGMEDYGFGGGPVNFTGKFYVTFTKDRNELYRIMQSRHLETLAKPQYYHSRVVRQLETTQLVVNTTEVEQRQLNFTTFLSSEGIMDLQLLPNQDFTQLNLRVHRAYQGFEVNKTARTEKSLQTMREVCKYAYKGTDCSSVIENVKMTRLDGIDIDETQGQDKEYMGMTQLQEAGGEIFTLENYKLIFKST